jgi:hypothetical protein
VGVFLPVLLLVSAPSVGWLSIKVRTLASEMANVIHGWETTTACEAVERSLNQIPFYRGQFLEVEICKLVRDRSPSDNLSAGG